MPPPSKRRVPAHAEIVPVDGCGSDKGGPGLWPLIYAVFPPRRLPLTDMMNAQRDAAGHAANRQMAGNNGIGRAGQFACFL